MIDIHAHILPGVDDGSPSVEASLAMLKEVASQGVTDMICTPHFREHFTCLPERLKEVFEEFKAEVKKQNIPVNLYLGQEIYAVDSVKKLIQEGKVLRLNNTEFVLLEFSTVNKTDIVETVYELRNAGFTPIVAHIERYRYLTMDDIYELKNEGGYIQVNASSLVGEGKRNYGKIVRKLFKEGCVDFVASDVHCGRKVCLKQAYDYVLKKFGEDAAEVVFKANAKQITEG